MFSVTDAADDVARAEAQRWAAGSWGPECIDRPQLAVRLAGRVRAGVRFLVTGARSARLLWAVRAAVPWPVRVLLGLAMAIKCLPLDFGADETLTVIAVLLLNRMRPGLLKACYREAQAGKPVRCGCGRCAS